MITEALGVVRVSYPCVTRDRSSLRISESLGVVRAVESMGHP